MNAAWSSEAQRPSKRLVFVAMAAGMAEMTVSVVPPWIMVYRRAELKPEVPTRP